MVTQILAFLRWQASKFNWRDYYLIAAISLIVVAWDYKWMVLMGSSAIILMAFFTLIKIQWDLWKRERRELLEKIKEPT